MKIYDITRFPAMIELGHDGENNWRPNRSYDEGMSRHDGVSRSIDVLKSMLNTAETEKERRAIRNHIAELER